MKGVNKGEIERGWEKERGREGERNIYIYIYI